MGGESGGKDMKKRERNKFAGTVGFVLAAAGSAVGLGNIWRFPYLAAKDGGGLFLVVYIILALTFGFTLLTSELAIGRKTKLSPLKAYGEMKSGWNFLGILSSAIPFIIFMYYCVIGGWVVKYALMYILGNGEQTTAEGYFGGFITSTWQPILFTVIFMVCCIVIVYRGVNKGIEASSKIIMPALLILVIGIAVFCLTIKGSAPDGSVRTGLEGFGVLVIPDFTGLTVGRFVTVVVDAMGQLFYSISVAMGIMVAYGSYVKDDANLVKSINQIELCDTVVAFLAGVMIIPAVYVFMGREGLAASGPSLMFVTLPKVFEEMGFAGHVVGALFFAMVFFAALTSAVSLMEAFTAGVLDHCHKMSRKKATVLCGLVTIAGAIVVCLGYNIFYFEVSFATVKNGQILDFLDYISNSFAMPILAICTCILIGWVVGPKAIVEEVEKSGAKFGRRGLYIVMVKYVSPILLTFLLLNSMGLITL